MSNEELKKDIESDLKRLKSIGVISSTEGGKLLIKACTNDVLSSIDTLRFGFTKLSHIEMIAHCAKLNERLSLLLTLKGVEKNAKIAEKDLKKLLEEEPEN